MLFLYLSVFSYPMETAQKLNYNNSASPQLSNTLSTISSLDIARGCYKNPAYRRHRISQPLWIVAQIPQQGGPRIHENQKKLKTEKVIQNGKTQKHLELWQNQQYTLRPEVSNPSGSLVSTMFCKAKSANNYFFFTR